MELYQRAKPPRSPEAEFFWKVSEQRSDSQGVPGQGIYVVTPSGRLLGFRQRDHDPKSIAQMLKNALGAWSALGSQERLGRSPTAASLPAPAPRDGRPPEGGLVLELIIRDLPRKSGPVESRLANLWNHDFAWFTQDEVRSMIPESGRAGDRQRVPDALVRRLVRLHFLDSVLGINDARPFQDKDIEKAQMWITVQKAEGGILRLAIEGNTRAVEPPLPGAPLSTVDSRERGFETRILGHATYEVKGQRFTSFELLAMGPRWGGRGFAHSLRQNDPGPEPMGVAARMVPGEEAGERTAPHYGSNYFGR